MIAEDGTLQRGGPRCCTTPRRETSLEQRCQNLYEKATKDPLTQVANRAEFDRVHAMFIAAHQQQHVPCSMMICDLDRFKLVNDTYGHQAGDEAIQSLATLLKSCLPARRPGGPLRRRGVRHAPGRLRQRRGRAAREQIRKLAEPTAAAEAGTAARSRPASASPKSSPATRRKPCSAAPTARLLMAKSSGRNCVVQLGSGAAALAALEPLPEGKLWRTQPGRPDAILQQDLVTPVPMKIAVEQLRGFVADHAAKIRSVEGNCVRLELAGRHAGWFRRRSDRTIGFFVELRLEEEQYRKAESVGDAMVRTRVHVAVSPRKNRDRRREDAAARAAHILASLRSYLMANLATTTEGEEVVGRTPRTILPWLASS